MRIFHPRLEKGALYENIGVQGSDGPEIEARDEIEKNTAAVSMFSGRLDEAIGLIQ